MNINPDFTSYSALDYDLLDSPTARSRKPFGIWQVERTGSRPEGVSVILNKDILFIKQHEADSPGERFLAATDSWLHGFPDIDSSLRLTGCGR